MGKMAKVILCVDDESLGLKLRRLVLEHAGYTVVTAENGADALRLFESEDVTAVVLDYSMPGLDGGKVAARMRQAKPEVPIMLLSAYVSLPSDVTSQVDMYLTKGEGAPALLKALDALLAMPAVSNPNRISTTAPA